MLCHKARFIGAVMVAAIVTYFSGGKAASAAEIHAILVFCSRIQVSGVTTAAAPFVRVTVVRSDNLLNRLAEKTEEVSRTVGSSFDVQLDFPEQANGTRLIITVGEWNGTRYINPATLYGQDCAGGIAVQPPAPTPHRPPVTQATKTFHSSALRFTIRYPNSWTVGAENNAVHFDSDETFGPGPERIRYQVYAREIPNPKGLPFTALATWGLNPPVIPPDLWQYFTYTRKTIGVYTAYETESLPSRFGMLAVFLTCDGTRYIELALTPYDSETPWPKQSQYERLFEDMLATFTME